LCGPLFLLLRVPGGPPFLGRLLAELELKGMLRPDFEVALRLLLQHGSSIDDPDVELLPRVVATCDAQLLQTVLDLGANRSMEYEGETPADIAHTCANAEAILKLLSS
jgi:hypothetical protein